MWGKIRAGPTTRGWRPAEMLQLLQQAPPPVPRQATPAFSGATVLRIIDGDTIEVEYQGQRETVRDIGINTPETRHPRKGIEYYGKEAKAANRRLVAGKTVRLEFDLQRREYVWAAPGLRLPP